MPRFSREENRHLIPVLEVWATEARDPKARGHFKSMLRKVQQSDTYHERKAAEQRKAGHVVQKP